MKITTPGVYDLSMAEYRGQPSDGWSFASSDAQVVAGVEPLTLAHLKASWGKVKKRERRADFGTAVHALVLEPFRAESQIVVIDAPDYKKDKPAAEADDAIAAGKTPMLVEQYERAKTVAARVLGHPQISKWLTGGVIEQSFFAKDDSGAWWKARPDLFTTDRIVIDLKSVGCTSDKFIRARIMDGGWYMQAPWYCDVIRRIDGELPQAFYWVCIEAEEPHAIRVISPASTTMDAGGRENEKARGIFRSVIGTGMWPAWPGGITELGLPDYAHYRLEELDQEPE